jgi:hypothetical protein
MAERRRKEAKEEESFNSFLTTVVLASIFVALAGT